MKGAGSDPDKFLGNMEVGEIDLLIEKPFAGPVQMPDPVISILCLPKILHFLSLFPVSQMP